MRRSTTSRQVQAIGETVPNKNFPPATMMLGNWKIYKAEEIIPRGGDRGGPEGGQEVTHRERASLPPSAQPAAEGGATRSGEGKRYLGRQFCSSLSSSAASPRR